MSTLYAIDTEVSTSVSANDTFPLYKTSTGRTMKAHASAIQTYVLGQSSSTGTLGFFGATATAQPGSTTAVSATTAVSTAVTVWGYSTSTQADAVVTLIRAIHANLISLGLKSA